MPTINLNDREFEKIILRIYQEEKIKLLESKSIRGMKSHGNKEEQNEVWGAVARAAIPLARKALPHVASYLGSKIFSGKKDDKSEPASTPSPTPAPTTSGVGNVKKAVTSGLDTLRKDPILGFIFEDLPNDDEKYTEMRETFRSEERPTSGGFAGQRPTQSRHAKTTFATQQNSGDEILNGLKGTISKIFDKQNQKKTQNKSTDDPLLGSFFN